MKSRLRCSRHSKDSLQLRRHHRAPAYRDHLRTAVRMESQVPLVVAVNTHACAPSPPPGILVVRSGRFSHVHRFHRNGRTQRIAADGLKAAETLELIAQHRTLPLPLCGERDVLEVAPSALTGYGARRCDAVW